MRLLKFNNYNVDIDELTAIGIDYQGYDFKNPGKRKISISNSFTIPVTSYNLKILGFPGNPHSLEVDIYNFITINYYNDNKHLIKNGNARITAVDEKRISVTIYEKPSFWSEMEKYLWPDFLQDFITWMQTSKGLPSVSSPFTGTWQQFVDTYLATTSGIVLPFYIGNLSKYGTPSYIEDVSNIWIKYNTSTSLPTHLGGHFCIYCKTIFEFIENEYDVDMSVLSTSYDYNIFEDSIASTMYVAARNISVKYHASGFYFEVDLDGIFSPDDNSEDKGSKSLGEFTKAFFNYFNCLIDKIPTTDSSEQYIIRRFDDIDNAPVIDFSGSITNGYKFSPLITGYKQVNYITFSTIYETGGNKLFNAKKIECLNKNIDAGGGDNSLLSIDAYMPGGIAISGDTLLDLSLSESFETFVFGVSSGQASVNIKIMEDNVTNTATSSLPIMRIYALTSEYNTLASMVQYPKVYTIKKRISLIDIDQIVYFAKYYIRELGGNFFLNKISGFNPQKANEATSIELIKLS